MPDEPLLSNGPESGGCVQDILMAFEKRRLWWLPVVLIA